MESNDNENAEKDVRHELMGFDDISEMPLPAQHALMSNICEMYQIGISLTEATFESSMTMAAFWELLAMHDEFKEMFRKAKIVYNRTMIEETGHGAIARFVSGIKKPFKVEKKIWYRNVPNERDSEGNVLSYKEVMAERTETIKENHISPSEMDKLLRINDDLQNEMKLLVPELDSAGEDYESLSMEELNRRIKEKENLLIGGGNQDNESNITDIEIDE